MACGARSGLKQGTLDGDRIVEIRRNGLWSPFGIETRFSFVFQTHSYTVGMACGARSGLKRNFVPLTIQLLYVGMACGARSGLKRSLQSHRLDQRSSSEWPVEPVRD